jgi:predicted RNA-binding Zn ribbon-like protein
VLRDPGDRAPAPSPLRQVQAFVNTVDHEHGIEEVGTPELLRALFVRLDLLGADEAVTTTDLAEALAVREALRALLLANNGGTVTSNALEPLNRAGRGAELAVRFTGAGEAALVPTVTGPAGALGQLVAIAFTAMADGSWERLKACRGNLCGWIYYDRSRNGSSTWCAMSVCGNRTKTRAYRSRARRRSER